MEAVVSVWVMMLLGVAALADLFFVGWFISRDVSHCLGG